MANQQHLDILRQGVEEWNQWREGRKEIEWEQSFRIVQNMRIQERYPHLVDLSGADLDHYELRQANLSGANLRGTRLIRADLREANLSNADLYQASFGQANLENATLNKASLIEASLPGANLWKAKLREANLSEARFFHAFLAEADLWRANLRQTNFTWAVLQEASLQEAHISHTIFGDVDFSEVKGLETLHHAYPPLIDIRTLARSSGRISEEFLRQSGIDSALIPALLALFHPYHGIDTCWWSEEGPSEPWSTGERPEAIIRPWPDEDMPSDEYFLPDLSSDPF